MLWIAIGTLLGIGIIASAGEVEASHLTSHTQRPGGDLQPGRC
jgi:hypothetical protein